VSNANWNMVKDMDIDALAEHGSVNAGSERAQSVHVAFQRLQTKAMQDAAKAQIDAAAEQKAASSALIRAAVATEATAASTADSARWLMWSVVVLAVTSVANILVTVWDHLSSVPHGG
jgi:hypothetical protein